ncbi:four-helix bundle copper-binding protein [Clostridium sp. MSJ-4]|uniref:Four-helix bundle copper-binding protein n=1 Tax=Clostridium simiarum TaxID=2841506 RepID=A0ABS6EVA7_9CLOT|nr:four-helix bundle copper-binding protein [Clostridium simiarum]MBU5590161.1 four-helix bundle copper-binding protein [Clostridium simiarum]
MRVATMTTNNYQRCIDECNRCAKVCYECFEACVNEPDLNTKGNLVKTLMECAKMCEMLAELMSINDQFAKEHCRFCASICDKCAQECGIFKDDHYQKCAQECSACAKECRKISDM